MIATVDIEFISPPGGLRGEQQNGSTYIRPQIFNPVMTDDNGLYICHVRILIESALFFNQLNPEILQIQSTFNMIG